MKGKTTITKKFTNYRQMNTILQDALAPQKFSSLDSQQSLQLLVDSLKFAYETSTTIKTFKTKKKDNGKPWSKDQQLIRMSNAKKKLLSRHRSNPRNSNLAIRISELNVLIANRRMYLARNFYTSKFNMSNSSREKWKELNKLLGRSKAAPAVRRIVSKEGVVHVDKQEKANEMNYHFASIGTEAAQGMTNTASGSRYNSKTMALTYVTKSEVERCVANLNPKKAAGIDGITNLNLKKCVASISEILCYSINKSFEEKIYPSILKVAKFFPYINQATKKTQTTIVQSLFFRASIKYLRQLLTNE